MGLEPPTFCQVSTAQPTNCASTKKRVWYGADFDHDESTIDNDNFSDVYGLAVSNDFLYVVDYGSSKIHKLTTAGEYQLGILSCSGQLVNFASFGDELTKGLIQ